MPRGTTQTQLDTHSSNRPAGHAVATSSAWVAYALPKPPTPNARPAARKSQPIGFRGRLETSTNPTTGVATFTT